MALLVQCFRLYSIRRNLTYMAGVNRNRSAANWPCSYIIAHIIIVQLNIASAYNQLRRRSYI